jgi:hypothetical protein
MKAKTAAGGTLYLICAILAGMSLILGQGSTSLMPFIGGVFALVWLFAAVWAFRELGNVYFTQYDTEVDHHVDYDLIIVKASRRVANQSSIGFLAGIGMLLMVFLLEGMYDLSILITDITNLLIFLAGVLSIVASMTLRSVPK